MVRRKQAKSEPSADAPAMVAVSPSASASSASAKPQQPRYSITSKDGYRVPRLLDSPKAYSRSLWDLYEATFAISMLETVSLIDRPRASGVG